MKRLTLFIMLLLCAAIYNAAARNQNNANLTAIIGATVIDGTGAEPKKAIVLMQGDRISAVAAGMEIPPGARIINAEGQTLMPGLFDLHTHLPYAAGGSVSGDWPKNLKAYLYCGVTSVVDFGTYPETFEPMRRLIGEGTVAAPRISLAARMTTPGGHGAEGGRGELFSLEVSTAREARAAVQRVLPYQPDVIKVFTDGWRYGNAPDMTSMNAETLTALVDEAHKHGIEVLTHTVTLERAKIAARAGVDVIAHGIGNAQVDEEVLSLMKNMGTTYAPTLAVYEPRTRAVLTPLLETVLEPQVLSSIQPPLTAAANGLNGQGQPNRRWQTLQSNTAALRAGGINFGSGTDAGVSGTYHGWATLRELQLLVAGGLTPLEAITAATGNSARAIKVDGERGIIAPGKIADLVLVAGEPHKNIGAIEKISRVFLGGRELDREKLALEIASSTITPIPAVQAREMIDDFESSDGRSGAGTLWVNSTDSGVDHSKMLFGRALREGSNHALSVTARMSGKDNPFARINLPLSRGAAEPVDAREFRGVRFDARGDGEYRLIIPTYNVRDQAHFQTKFKASTQWQTVNIEFSSLNRDGGRLPATWTAGDLLMLSFEIARPAGAFAWMEIDNLQFYR
jgi:imidazolonepropionase-like amidohydrolase